jgi:primosomal replication protein N
LDRANRLTLACQLAARDALRYTPGGVPIVRFTVGHASRQVEAGGERGVELELACVAVEEQAKVIAAAPLGIGLELAGFLAPRTRSGRQLALHVTEIRFVEGEAHAPTR